MSESFSVHPDSKARQQMLSEKQLEAAFKQEENPSREPTPRSSTKCKFELAQKLVSARESSACSMLTAVLRKRFACFPRRFAVLEKAAHSSAPSARP